MKFMVIVKADKNSEAGHLPSPELLKNMMNFNEELAKAGVMLAAEGLHPSSEGKRVHFGDGKTTVVDGPFAETKELVGGYWIWQTKSMEEALNWLKRAPFDAGAVVEIRKVYDFEEFGELQTPELTAQYERLHSELANKK